MDISDSMANNNPRLFNEIFYLIVSILLLCVLILYFKSDNYKKNKTLVISNSWSPFYS